MQSSDYGSCEPTGRISGYTLHNMNEGSDDSEANMSGYGLGGGGGVGGKRSADDAGFEPESIGISSDDESVDKGIEPPKKTPPPNGKKTKGRVKIKMEFIDNKLRRYTTFSKRKTGIMKKAYELSTLTGTQVMLLVASETGHVYTFATRKLQPMITSEAGKALIQTCLNSPDPPLGHSQQLDQRMSATGFEETDLTYSIADDDQKEVKLQQMYSGGSHTESSNSPIPQSECSTPMPVTSGMNTSTSTTKSNISMQLQSAGYQAILGAGTQLHLGAMPAHSSSQSHQHNSQALYRLPHQSVVSLPAHSSASHQSSISDSSSNTVTVVPSTQSNLSVVPGQAVVAATTANSLSGTVMYQTAQGVVYATSTSGALPEGVILNFGQASTLQIPQDQGGTSAPHQFITIPVPVSLTTAPQLIASAQAGLSPSSSSNSSEPCSSPGATDLSKSSSRK